VSQANWNGLRLQWGAHPLHALGVLRSLLPLLLAGPLVACTTPRIDTNGELALELSARALPGWGAGVGFLQRMNEGPTRTDIEAGAELQRLPDEGPRGNDWSRVWGGLRWSRAEPELPAGALRAGLTWMRADADPLFLRGAEDYGGVYLGVALDTLTVGAWSLGPDLEVFVVDSEGSTNRYELAAQVAFHFRRRF
jgi:hypothetical protein